MNIKKLNKLLEQVLDETRSKNLIQFGSFHDDPETIYYNTDTNLTDSFDNRDFDNSDSVEIKKGNLLFLSANDEEITVYETDYKNKDAFIKAMKAGYPKIKADFDEEGLVEVGVWEGHAPVFEVFGGYVIEEEEDIKDVDTFCKVLIDWFNNTYIDKDSGNVYCLIDPKTLDIVLGGSVDLWQYNPEDWGDDEL